MPVVILMPVNTSRREGYRLTAGRWTVFPNAGDVRLSDIRHQTSDILYSRQQEGSGAFGARVLSFVCFAPNDGFCSQSGLVQRGVINAV